MHWTTTHSTGSGKDRKTTTKHHHAYAHRKLVSIDVPIAQFQAGQIQPGRYEFPFTAQLPGNLPSTMYASGGGGDCKIHYGVKAQLHRPGYLKWEIKSSCPFKLSSTPLPPVAFPAFVEPVEKSVNVSHASPSRAPTSAGH